MNTQIFNADSIIANAIASAKSDEVNAMLDKYGLNWKVNKQSLVFVDGFTSVDSGFVGLRKENSSTCFAAVKPSYEVFQNHELAELLLRVCEKTGYELHKGGSFSKGAKVYLQLKTGEEKNIGKNLDTVEKYATALNFHDQSGAMKWGHSNLTITCQNTFHVVSGQLANSGQSFSHSKNMRDRIEASLRELETLHKIEVEVFNRFRKMSDIPTTRKDIVQVVKVGAGVDMTLPKNEFEKYTTYKINRMNELLEAINTEMEQKGATLWGLFSGLTKYTSHIMPVKDRDESKFIGTAGKLDNKIFTSLLS